MKQQPDLMTTGDAARICNRTPDTIRHWARIGRLPAIMASSGQRLFNRSDVVTLAAEVEAQDAAELAGMSPRRSIRGRKA